VTTLAELVAAEPAPTAGVPTQIDYGTGIWRLVYEIADPAAGVDVEWFDVTVDVAGHENVRGADQYAGRYRASVATFDLWAADDTFAPWNDDTSPTFGTHVELGPGLLARCGLILVSGGEVTAWNPRWTNRVERWGDACYAGGQLRRHTVVTRDLLTSLVNVPVPASSEQNWSERVEFLLTEAGWAFGSTVYGATFDTAVDVLTVPARAAQSSALDELWATLDPAGLCLYTDRAGQLIVRPTVFDTFHTAAFASGADGTPAPSPGPVGFAYFAESGGIDLAAYATEGVGVDPFGFDKAEDAVINHVVIVGPGGTFDDDDPISIQRYDRKSLQATWIQDNDVAALDLLTYRANAVVEARPLYTTVDLFGFHPGPAELDYLGYTAIQHQTQEGRPFVFGNGWVRQYTERIAPQGVGRIGWDIAFTVDVYNVETDSVLLPVEDLAVVDVSDMVAEFSWTNPSQTITPTHTQIRLLNPASLWATVDYPITGIVWGGLAPSTDYEFQGRLLRQVDGVVTHYSASRSVEFTTDPTTIPVWDGPDVDFPEPGGGCTIEWELQSSDDGGATVLGTVDDGTIVAPPWTLAGYDTSGLDNDLLYRFRQREMCPSAGAWVYGPWFAVDCLAVPALADPPFDDAVAYWPQICPPDSVREAISDEEATHGLAFAGFSTDDDGNPTLVTGGLEGCVVYGVGPAVVDALTLDTSIVWEGTLGAQPDGTISLAHFAGMWIEATVDGAGWAPTGNAIELVGGITTIAGGTTLDLDTFYRVALTHDAAAGDLILYIDAVEEADALGVVGERSNSGIWQIDLPADSSATRIGVWDRVLAASELPGYVAPPATLDSAILALSPLGYWRLDETSGTTATDSSGNGRHGTYSGTITKNATTGADGDPVPNFDGGAIIIGDYDEFTLGSVGLTVFCIVKPDATPSSRRFMVTKGNTSNYEWDFYLENAGDLLFSAFSSAGNDRSTNGIAAVVTSGAWHVVAANIDDGFTIAGPIDMWHNGTLVVDSSIGSGTGTPANGGAALYIGHRADGGGSAFDGFICRVAIFADDIDLSTVMAAAEDEGWF